MQRQWLALLVGVAVVVLGGCLGQFSSPSEEAATATLSDATRLPPSTVVGLTPVPTPTQVPIAHPPVLLAVYPQPGEEVSVDSILDWRFDQPIDQTSFASALRISPPVKGKLVWDAPDHVLLRPVALSPATRYVVSLDSTVRSSLGVTLPTPVRYGFLTNTPLRVTQVSPENGSTDVHTNAPIVVDFNRPMVAINCVGQKADDKLCPTLPLVFTPPVAGYGTWVTTSRYRFDVTEIMVAGESYKVSLAASVASVDGQSLKAPYEWVFQTIPPRLVGFSPTSGETDVLLDATIRVTFTTPMDQAKTGAVFRVDSEDGEPVPGTIMWGNAGTVLVYTPTIRLDLGKTYRVRVGEGARALASTPLENPMAWSFTTVGPPALVGFSPANGSEGYGIRTPVRLRFVGAIDPNSLEASVEISPSVDLGQRYGYFNVQEGTYYLSWDREPQTRYCITVNPSLRDIYGNHLREPATFCFVTNNLPPLLEPVALEQVLTLSREEPAEVFFLARNVSQVKFRLYELDLAAFMKSKATEGELLRAWTQSFSLPMNEPAGVNVPLRRLGGALPTGFYRLTWQLPNERYERQLNIVVIGRHLTLKHASQQSLVWLTDLGTGHPISQTAVRLVDQAGLLVAGAATDENGLAWLYTAPRETLWSPVAAVCGEPGEPDFGFAMSTWGAEAAPWELGLDFDGGPWSPYRVFLQTDRPIYRPGQTISFSAFVREFDAALGYSLPRSRGTITVTLRDPTWRAVYTKTMEMPQQGQFAGQIVLREHLLTGVYHLVVDAETPGTSQVLSVADVDLAIAAYHKPLYSVDVSPSVTATVQSAPVRFTLKAEYYAGGAVTGADVQWTVYVEPTYFHPNDDGSWQWGGGTQPWRRAVVAQGRTQTDEYGQALVALETKVSAALDGSEDVRHLGPLLWTFEAVVLDESGTAVAAETHLVVHPSDVYVGLRPHSWVVEAKRRLAVDVLMADFKGRSVDTQKVHVTLSQRTWQAPALPGGAWHYTDTLVAEQDVLAGSEAPVTVEFRVPSPGLYVVVAEAIDSSGNPARSEVPVWAGGVGTEAMLWRPTGERIELVPDAQRYRVGDVAKVLVPIDISGPYELLLTVEREGVLSAEYMHLDRPNPVLEVPILETAPGYVPNVFVSVVLISPADPVAKTQVGYARLEVDPAPYLLSVEVVPDRDCYRPGESAVLKIKTRDIAGQPVPADVILAVVDPAVLSLRPASSQSIQKVFYGSRALAVLTGDAGLVSLARMRSQAEHWLAVLEEQAQGLGGLGGGAGEGAGLDPRVHFPDTALWLPRLTTDISGEAEVVLQLPDSLTTWVIRAWAISTSAPVVSVAQPAVRVGEAEATLRVWKPLAAEPLLPRALVIGDSTTIGSMIYNNTDGPLEVSVDLTVSAGVALSAPSLKQVSVPAAQQVRVTWPVTVDKEMTATVATVLISVQAGSYRDAVQGHIDIQHYVTTSFVGNAGVLEGAGRRVEAVIVPSGVGPRTSLTLNIDTSLVSPLRSVVLSTLERSHTTQPTDAWVSSLLPAVASLRALQALGLEEADSDLHTSIREAFERIYAHQNADGGWGWWQGPSQPRLTLYVCLGMLDARDAGIEIHRDVLDRSLDYTERFLSQSLSEAPEASPGDTQMALGAYLLALAGRSLPDGVGGILYENRGQLGASGHALLAMALAAIDARDPRAATLLEELRSAAVVSGSGAYWDEESPREWITPVQATATVVKALSTLAPTDPLLPHAVRWLMLTRLSETWYTPYETAWATLALADYVSASGDVSPEYAWRIALLSPDGQTTASEVEGEDESVSLTFKLGESLGSWTFQQGLNLFAIERGAGRGKLYYNARLRTEIALNALDKPVSRGLDIERHYCKVSLPIDLEGQEGDRCEPVTSVHVGDVVLVRLNVIVHDSAYYVHVVDPYPGGFTALNPLISTTPTQRISSEYSWDRVEGTWLPGDFVWQDLRDEAAHFYADRLSAGVHEGVYLLRAAVPGTYTALPARVEVSHFPEVWGRTPAMQLTVLEHASESSD